MRMTKKEILFIEGYFQVMKKYMKAPETRRNLLQYGFFAGRFYQILIKRVDLDKSEEIDRYIKDTLGNEVFEWFISEHREFMNKKGENNE